MRVRIEGRELPGRHCAGNGDVPGYADVHVGVQRKDRPDELLDPQPADASSAVWEFDVDVRERPDGPDVRGRYIQGGPGKRFIYLSWVCVDGDQRMTMFRRAKLFLADVDADVLTRAIGTGTLVARIGLTNGKGNPVCARIRPPAVEWSAA